MHGIDGGVDGTVGPHTPSAEGRTQNDRHITALVYNPHGECFATKRPYSWTKELGWHNNYPKCEQHVTAFLDEVLASNASQKVDFAGLVYTNGRYTAPEHMGKVESSRCLTKHGNDDVLLLYDTRVWATKGDPHMGCMEGDLGGRPFLIQGFRGMGTTPSASPLTLLVVAAHFPHPHIATGNFDGQEILRKEVQAAKQSLSVDKILLVADTNFADFMVGSRGSSIMQAIGGGIAYRTTTFAYTCCVSEGIEAFRYKGFDRVISNFGRSMDTKFPLKASQVMKWGAQNMHLPVLGSLELCDEPTTLCGRAAPLRYWLSVILVAFILAVFTS